MATSPMWSTEIYKICGKLQLILRYINHTFLNTYIILKYYNYLVYRIAGNFNGGKF